MSQNSKVFPGHIELNKALVRCAPFISSSHYKLLHILMISANPDGTNIYIGVKTLATKMGFQVRWTQKLLHDLEEEGYIIAIKKKGGRGIYSTYAIGLEKFGLTAAPSPETVTQAADRPPTTPESPADSPPELPDWSQPSDEEKYERLKQRVLDYEGRVQRNPTNPLYQGILEEARENLRVFELESEVQHA